MNPTATDFERIERLLALLVIKGEPQAESDSTPLSRWFPCAEIGRLLGMKSDAVRQAAHRDRTK